MSFSKLGLSDAIVRAVTQHGYTVPTPIQTQAIPAVLAGGDLLAGALLVTEAGGIVGEFSGESDYLYKGDIIAASPKVFGQMVPLLAQFA